MTLSILLHIAVWDAGVDAMLQRLDVRKVALHRFSLETSRDGRPPARAMAGLSPAAGYE